MSSLTNAERRRISTPAVGSGGRKAEHARIAAGRPRHAEQDLDGGGLACAVPAEEPEDRSRGHTQVQSAQRFHIVVALRQAGRFDHRAISHRDLRSSAFRASSASIKRRISSSVMPRCTQSLDALRDQRLRGFQPLGVLQGWPFVRDEGAGALPEFDHAFMFELAIGLGHGVGIHDELFREGPDAGQLLAGLQRARFDGVFHLLDQLEINRHARRRIRLEKNHCTTDIIQ